MDIQALLKRIENGDRSAFSPVVQHFQHSLFGYLGRMGLPQSLAEEVAQETFLRAWKNLNGYDTSRAEFSTWLFTIARNLALNELTRAANQNEVADDDLLQNYASINAEPDAAFSQAQLQKRLLKALLTLSIPDRSAIALAYLQELDLKAIARVEGCSTNAIKVRLHRAKQRLRELLEKQHE